MKLNKLLVGGLGLITSASTFAFGYDSATDAPVGDRPSERHTIQFITEIGDCADAGICLATASPGSEFVAMIEVLNTTECANPGSQCVPTNTPDTYVGTGGVASSGAKPLVPIAEIYLPNAPYATNADREVDLATSLSDWNFTTTGTGRLDTGYIISDSSFGAGTVGVFLLEEQIVRTYRGTSADVTTSCATDANADYQTCWAGGPISTSAGPATEQHFDYVTQPQLTTLEKAVPVPAFAAAALGLGLVGITILTGRRRQVK